MKKILPFILFCVAVSANANTKFYVADDETNFSNPERGFYTASEQDIKTSTTKSNLSDGEFNASSGRSLILRQYIFSDFRQDSLSQAALDIVEADFATCRKNGFKCVLRFSYTVDFNEGGPYEDGTPEIWKKHLEQLKPVLQANADVIATVQAGFIGVWGEWHYSSQGIGTKVPKDVRKNLIDQLLDAVPVSRTIQLRTPQFKKTYVGDNNPLTLEEAFSGSPRSRIGHHNDAFLYGENNMGTYNNRKKDMDYLDQECLYVPNGGETDVLDQDIYDQWATGDKAKADMAKVHFSYMNQDYTPLVIGNWKQAGVFTDIAMHLGYRFQLIEATVPALVRPSETMSVMLNIRNVGFATPYNERKAYVVLYNESNTYRLVLDSDPRLWAPNNAVTEISEALALPAGIVEGTYNVALYMPDASASIADDPRYAVRIANYDMWDDKTGYNNLGMQVIVSATEPEPQPEPEPTPDKGVDAITNLKGVAGYSFVNLSWKNPGDVPTMDTLQVDLSQGMDTAYNGDLGNSSATVTYKDGVSSISYETKKVWLWAGSRYLVDSLTDISSVSFEIKGDGTSTSLYAYAHDGVYRWIEDALAIPLSQKKWVKYTYTPQKPLWNDSTPKHQFGDKPIIDLSFIANPATASKGSFELRNVCVLKQHKASEDSFAGVRIIRKEGAQPTSFSDGTTIYFGKGTACTDAGLEYGKTYYYAAYTFSKDGKMAFPVYYSVTIDGTGIGEIHAVPSAASKFIQGGQLLIMRDGMLYDTTGRKIQ